MHRAVDELASRDTFRGYGPEQGYEFLRHAIAENDYRQRGMNIEDDEIFVSDGSKCDCGNILDIFGHQNRIAVVDPVYPVYVDTNVMAGHTGAANDVRRLRRGSFISLARRKTVLFRKSPTSASILFIFAFRTIQPVRWPPGNNSKDG